MKKYQLMAPGPTPVPSNVLLAMARPMIHHRTPEYEALFTEVRAGLKTLFQTTQDVIPLTCSGTGALEAAVVNTCSAGDTVAVVRAGKFGERWVEILRAYGLNVIELTAPFGDTVAPARIEETLAKTPGVKAVFTQHSESSTGVLHDVRGYAEATRSTDAILGVVAVSWTDACGELRSCMKTNRAGGLEGGMTTGAPLVVRGRMKPLPTLTKPLRSVDIATHEPAEALRARARELRGRALGVWGLGMMLAPTFGPTISGWIVDNLNDWRLIFFLGIPFGVAALFKYVAGADILAGCTILAPPGVPAVRPLR